MGGKAHADNQQIVEEQKKQAADALAKEAKRQARLTGGLKRINYAFEGKPVTAPTAHTFDWKTFTPVATKDKTGKAVAQGKLPAGFKYVKVNAQGQVIPDTPAQAATTGGFTADPYAGQAGYGGSAGTATYNPGKAAVAATPAPAGQWAIQGPKGKIFKKGDVLNYSSDDPTGATTGGFDQAFYDKYTKSITDYYDPQVADQYKKATDELTYRLARAGTSVSSAGDTEVADLAKQNVDNLAGIGNKALTATGDLKAKVASEKTKAVNQLYATENPDVAANQALASVRDISLQQPDLSPLAQLFNIAAVGGSNIMKQYNNQNLVGNFQSDIQKSSGHIV